MMAKPMKTLELHYPTIQFMIINYTPYDHYYMMITWRSFLTWQGQIEEKNTLGQESLPRLGECSALWGLNPRDRKASSFLELLGTETKENLKQLE